MGGAQFFWRVTLVEGRGKDGTFRLEECSLPLDEPKPKRVPYRERPSLLTYYDLRGQIPYVGEEICQVALTLSRENQSAERYFARHLPV